MSLGQFNQINLGIPNIEKVIDYCKLHGTTKIEDYRKLAIDGCRGYKNMLDLWNTFLSKPISGLYPFILKELEIESFNQLREKLDKEYIPLINGLEKIMNELSNGFDIKGINRWKNYCLGCSTNEIGGKVCQNHRQSLISFKNKYQEKIKRAVDEAIVLVKPFLGKILENPPKNLFRKI